MLLLVSLLLFCLFVCLELQINQFVISTFKPVFFIEISFDLPPPLVCCQPTEMIWAFLFHKFSIYPPSPAGLIERIFEREPRYISDLDEALAHLIPIVRNIVSRFGGLFLGLHAINEKYLQNLKWVRPIVMETPFQTLCPITQKMNCTET